MAGFSVDYSKASSTHNVPDGEYETTISSAAWAKTSKGTEYIQLKLAVRGDVAQPEQGETIEYPLWKSQPEYRKPSDINGIPAWRIHAVSKAVQLPDGEQIQSIDDWFRLITGKPVCVTTKQDEQGRARVQRVEASKQPDVKAGFVAIDDDTPF